MDQQAARRHLAAYLFRGDDVDKPLKALSGGERARLALAILALEGANFLVLDEPTNHLDIPAREALQEVLDNFHGTILLVSHDRFLIDQLATQIWTLRDGKMDVFKGTYKEYVMRQAALLSNTAARQTMLTRKVIMKVDGKEARQRAQSLERLEARIHEQEKALQRLYSDLQRASDRQAFDRVGDIGAKIAHTQAVLDELLAEWEKLAA